MLQSSKITKVTRTEIRHSEKLKDFSPNKWQNLDLAQADCKPTLFTVALVTSRIRAPRLPCAQKC